ncbi:MAG: pyridoxal phosphate-dependent aminotransferase [Clostridium sp.]|nr:pyridoxal phosphate-dependent aminotransferase [Clostridium sp.]
MKFNFDEIVDRSAVSCTYSSKWERYSGRFPEFTIDEGRSLPMWVADMDFKCIPEVVEALHRRVEHGIFGYSNENTCDVFKEAAREWFSRRYGWESRTEWMLYSMGVVAAINNAIQEFTREGQGVIIQSPVYYPFAAGARNNRRRVVENPLIEENGTYRMDYENLEQLARDPNNTMMILCSPHNPVGRVWEKLELFQALEICYHNGVMVFCDEIHGDLIMPGHSFFTCGLFPEFYSHMILAHSPSKTFNLAGLTSAILTVPDSGNRKRLAHRIYDINRIPSTQNFGPVAGAAAYNHGDAFADEVMEYIQENVEFAREYLRENLQQIKIVVPEGTYLTWFDFRGTGLPEEEIYRRVLEHARVIGDLGRWFGRNGEGFVRFNYACPRVYVKEQLERLRTAF